MKSFTYEDIDEGLPALMGAVLAGTEQGSRNGRTKELCHVALTYTDPTPREILTLDRKVNIAAQIAETAWVLAGRNDIEFLQRYLPRASDYSDDGTTWRGGYGPRIRDWKIGGQDSVNRVDQLQHVIDVLRVDPLSRRAVIAIYDPAVDTEPGKDIPCNDFLMFTNRLGKLDMHVVIRSNDLMWGHSGINYFEWSVLQEIVAGMLGVHVGSLHFSIASLHLYEPYWGKAEKISHGGQAYGFRVRQALKPSPAFDPTGFDDTSSLDECLRLFFAVEKKIRTESTVGAKFVENFPEPMFQSWLRVLQWWWSGDEDYLEPLRGTRLHAACFKALQPPPRLPVTVQRGGIQFPTPEDVLPEESFDDYVCRLHDEKHAAYGDSWKRRGEMLGIMANIARKIDRLGSAGTSDENALDTAIDLLVYLAKYRVWIVDQQNGTDQSDTTEKTNNLIRMQYRADNHLDRAGTEELLRNLFEELEGYVVTKHQSGRRHTVDDMLESAYELAASLWDAKGDDYRGADSD